MAWYDDIFSGIGDVLSNTGDEIIGGIGDLLFTGEGEDRSLDLGTLLPLLITGVGHSQGWFDADEPKIGYQGEIPRYKAANRTVPQNYQYPDRMPGEYGQRYFTDTIYADKNDPAAVTAAADAVNQQASQLAVANREQGNAIAPLIERMQAGYTDYRKPLYEKSFAAGGIASTPQAAIFGGNDFMSGASPAPANPAGMQPKGNAFGAYINGPGDGMSDSVPATLGGQAPAALGDGEFVVPADVVSHLGNGSSNAGAERLQNMMDRVRQARTGRQSQGSRINPQEYMPV